MIRLNEITDWQQMVGNVVNADCIEAMKMIPDKSIDLVLTDPPYGINKEGIVGDDLPTDKYREWIKKIIAEIERVSKDGYFIFNNEIMLFKLADLYNECRLFASCNNFAIMGRGMPYAWSPIVFKVKDKKSWTGKGRNWFISNTATMINTPKNIGHPTPKPLDVCKYIINQFNSKTILDPFLGSGTTAVACKELGRRWIGIEISEEYCRIADKRLSQNLLY